MCQWFECLAFVQLSLVEQEFYIKEKRDEIAAFVPSQADYF